MSVVSILEKPAPPYRYLYLSGCIFYSIILLLLVNDLLPPFDPITLTAGSSFAIGLAAAFLMSWQPFEGLFDWLLRRKEGTAYDPMAWPKRNRVAKYRFLQADRETFFNNLSLTLGTTCLVPGLLVSLQLWPHPLELCLPAFALTMVGLFAAMTFVKLRRFRKHLDLAYAAVKVVRKPEVYPTTMPEVLNQIGKILQNQDWEWLEDLSREGRLAR
jgi:hypothetical protein